MARLNTTQKRIIRWVGALWMAGLFSAGLWTGRVGGWVTVFAIVTAVLIALFYEFKDVSKGSVGVSSPNDDNECLNEETNNE